MRRRSAALLIIPILLIAACSRPAQVPPANPTPVATPEPIPPVASPAPAESRRFQAAALFPASDRQMDFQVYDSPRPFAEVVEVREVWLREGDRVVGVYSGKPYVTWLLEPDGVWRQDPRGGGALLRYLPPQLEDGLVWKQASGDGEVWFRLARIPGSREDQPNWSVTVLNQGERSTFFFAPERGVYEVLAEHFVRPDDSFYKRVAESRQPPWEIPAQQRATWLKAAPAPSGGKAPAVAAGAREWGAALDKLPGVTTVQADLDGDGKTELIWGQLGTWSAATVEIRRAGSEQRTSLATPQGGQHRLWLVRFDRINGDFIAGLARGNGGSNFSLYRLDGQSLDGVRGWAPKVTAGAASRVEVSPDGRITLDWEMEDPAGHTRTRRYRLEPDGKTVRLESETFRPTGKELAYPADPEALLRAAWITRWYPAFDAELERYFETPQAAAAFRAADKMGTPYWDSWQVALATVGVEGKAPFCSFRREPAVPKDGILPFVAEWFGYEDWRGAAGRAVVVEKDGRWVIREIRIDQTCNGSM